jgi:cytochrome c biogenesis factor
MITSVNNEDDLPADPKEILTVDVSNKPFISLVWLGIFVMAVGFVIVSLRRSNELK